MSSKIFRLTPRRIKKIIAEEKQKIELEKKKQLFEALKTYKYLKETNQLTKKRLTNLKKYIKTLK